MKFLDFLKEATIHGFMDKIRSCQTLDGLSELEDYYNKRIKDIDIEDSDDIAIRDAMAGKKEEISGLENEE